MLPLRGDGIRPEDDLGEDGDLGEAAAADCDGGCGDTADGGLKDGALRLTGGHNDTEVSWPQHVSRVTCHVSRVPVQGNLEVWHEGAWGGVCDDEWDEGDARVACRQVSEGHQ